MTTAAALDALADKLAGIERKRSPVEAPVRKTDAYVDLLFGLGYARAGEVEWAHTRFRAARSKLSEWSGDPAHAWLLRAFDARLAFVVAGRPEAAWAPELLADLDTLGKVYRYKVDRLREVSRLLDPAGASIDAIGDFNPENRKWALHPPRPIDVSSLATQGELRTAFDRGLQGGDLARALALLADMPDATVDTYAAAIGNLAFACDPELIDAVIRALEASAIRTTGSGVENVLEGLAFVVGGLAKARRHERLQAIERLAQPLSAAERDKLRRVIARVATQPAMRPAIPTTRLLDTVRAAAEATRSEPPEAALVDVLALADHFASVTDSFGTNSHYALSVVAFVDALVWPLVDREVR